MFIEINKISNKGKEAEDGTAVKNPLNKGVVKDVKIEIHTETIRIDEIRSFRKWNKTHEQEAYIDGDVTKIYFKGDKVKTSKPEMLIAESYHSFADRLNTVRTNVTNG